MRAVSASYCLPPGKPGICARFLLFIVFIMNIMLRLLLEVNS